MINKYFTVEVTPTIAASKQHLGAFTEGDVLFNWTSFDVPKGTSRLIGATMLVRPRGNAAVAANVFGAQLLFSKTEDISFGIINATPNKRPSNDYLGFVEIESTTAFPLTQLKSTTIGMAGRSSNTSPQPNLVLTPTLTGTNVGYDKLYVAGMAEGAFNFTSINVINDADINSTSVSSIVMAGTSMDVRQHFLPGDVLHAEDDTLLGTAEGVDSATSLRITEATSGAGDATTVANGDTIYSINPVRLILHFEK